MQIRSYQNASNIEERYLPQLSERQAECWGAEPFDEYRICTNNDCKALFSIEEVLGGVMEIRNLQNKDNHFSCSECDSDTEEMYPREEFIKLMRQYFVGEVSGLLIIDEQDSVEGFGFISKTTIRSLMEFEFNTRPSSYNTEETIKKLGHILYGSEDADEGEVICFNQIYLSPPIRNAELSYTALKNLFEINREDYRNIPLIGDTKYDNKFYPIIRSVGAQNIVHDKYGYAVQVLSKCSDMLEFLNKHKGYKDFVGDMVKYKKEARSILREHPEFTGRKFYK